MSYEVLTVVCRNHAKGKEHSRMISMKYWRGIDYNHVKKTDLVGCAFEPRGFATTSWIIQEEELEYTWSKDSYAYSCTTEGTETIITSAIHHKDCKVRVNWKAPGRSRRDGFNLEFVVARRFRSASLVPKHNDMGAQPLVGVPLDCL